MKYFIFLMILSLFSCSNMELNNSHKDSTKSYPTIKEKTLTQGVMSPKDIQYVFSSCKSADTSWFDLSEVDTLGLVKINNYFFSKYLLRFGFRQDRNSRWYFKNQFDNDSIVVCTVININIENMDGKDYINGSTFYVMIINKNKREIVSFKAIENTYFTPSGGRYASISQKKLDQFDIDSYDEWAEETTTTNSFRVTVSILDNFTLKFDTLEHKKAIK